MSVYQVVHLQLDILSRKRAMTKADHVPYLEYTYDATGSGLAAKLFDVPLLAVYLPLVSSDFVQYRLYAKVSLSWVALTRLY